MGVRLNVLDLFSGIGGFSLGLERAGMRTVAFCEIDPYCRAVLRKHWPDVPCFGDVRDLHAYDCGPVDLICGGFPCQDISVAGRGAGMAGERSGLWSEYRRLIEEARPSWVIVENVSALRARGLDQVLGELDALGYDAEWHCIPASAVGAPHRRDRVWIVAHAERVAPRHRPGGAGDLACAPGADQGERHQRQRDGDAAVDCRANVADASSSRLSERLRAEIERGAVREEGDAAPAGSWWAVEPAVGRVANGIPSRVDRLRALGNSVVPQIPEIIGRAIIEAEERCRSVRS